MKPAILRAAIGEELCGRQRRITLARALALSGGPFDMPGWPERNLHTDLDAAHEAGLAAIVASGTQWGGYTVGFLVELCGLAWFEHGELDVRITRSVRIGETLTPRVVLEARAAEPGGIKVELGVRCDNQDRAHVLIGKARCLLPLEADSKPV